MPNWLSNNVLKIYDAYLKKYNIMDKNDPLSGYNKIPLCQIVPMAPFTLLCTLDIR